jgi:hypothetical protein
MMKSASGKRRIALVPLTAVCFPGRKLAEQRHRYMEEFLEQFHAECDGRR